MLNGVQELVGATEIATLLGVTRQRIHQLTKEATFPTPIARLTLGAVWRTEDIQRWAQQHRPDLGLGSAEKPPPDGDQIDLNRPRTSSGEVDNDPPTTTAR